MRALLLAFLVAPLMHSESDAAIFVDDFSSYSTGGVTELNDFTVSGNISIQNTPSLNFFPAVGNYLHIASGGSIVSKFEFSAGIYQLGLAIKGPMDGSTQNFAFMLGDTLIAGPVIHSGAGIGPGTTGVYSNGGRLTIQTTGDGGGIFLDNLSLSAGGFISSGIPEPSTWAMLLIGFAGIGFTTYYRRRKVGGFAARPEMI